MTTEIQDSQEREENAKKEKEIGGIETAKSYRPIDWVGDHVSNE